MEHFRHGAPLSMLDCIFAEEEETAPENASDENRLAQEALLEKVLRHLTYRRNRQENPNNAALRKRMVEQERIRLENLDESQSDSIKYRKKLKRYSKLDRVERHVLHCLLENLEAIEEIGTPKEGRKNMKVLMRNLRKTTKKTRIKKRRKRRRRKAEKKPDSFEAAMAKLCALKDMVNEQNEKLSQKSRRRNVSRSELKKDLESASEELRQRLLVRIELENERKRIWLQKRAEWARARRRPQNRRNRTP